MATGTASPNYHGQLTANTVDTITMDRDWGTVQVINDDGTSRIDFTVDGTAPVVGGTATGRVLPAAICVDSDAGIAGNAVTVVKLISAGTPKYSIIGGSA